MSIRKFMLLRDLSMTLCTCCSPGASSGIGEACAWRFAEAGCKLVLTARRLERLEAVRDQLTQQYGSAVHIAQLDMRDLDAVSSLPSTLPAEFQKVKDRTGSGVSPGCSCIRFGSTVRCMPAVPVFHMKCHHGWHVNVSYV